MLKNLATLFGFGLLVAGCYWVWPPFGLIVSGILLLTGSIIGHIRTPSRRQ